MTDTGKSLDDHELARALAITAGAVLLNVQQSALLTGKTLGAVGDRVAHRFLADALETLRPHDRVLSEEGDGTVTGEESGSRIWIVDPLDGTREFSEGRTDWAVHVALVEHHRVIAAAVAIPGLDTIHSTANQHTPSPAWDTGLRFLVSRSRPPAVATEVAETMGAALVPMGSAGAKAMAVVRGEASAYLHAGGQYEWDSAAPVGVALAAGLHASRLDGSPLHYDAEEPLLPDLLICQPQIATDLLTAIAKSQRPRLA